MALFPMNIGSGGGTTLSKPCAIIDHSTLAFINRDRGALIFDSTGILQVLREPNIQDVYGYSFEFTYTSSLHKLIAISVNGGTYYVLGGIQSNASTPTAEIKTVGPGEVIAGYSSGANNFFYIIIQL